MSKRRLLAFIIIDLLLAYSVYRGYQAWSEREQLAITAELRERGATMFPEARPLSAFKLLDQEGEPFTNESLHGQWNLLFFGYTRCPDICPLTMKELAEFYGQLSQVEQEKVQVILGSIDPERDDSATMKDYVGKFNEEFVGITGTRVDMSVLSKQLYIVYSDPSELIEHDGHDERELREQRSQQNLNEAAAQATGDHSEHFESADDYLISHSGHIAIIDPQGNFHGVIRLPHRDRDLLAIMRSVLESE